MNQSVNYAYEKFYNTGPWMEKMSEMADVSSPSKGRWKSARRGSERNKFIIEVIFPCFLNVTFIFPISVIPKSYYFPPFYNLFPQLLSTESYFFSLFSTITFILLALFYCYFYISHTFLLLLLYFLLFSTITLIFSCSFLPLLLYFSPLPGSWSSSKSRLVPIYIVCTIDI